MRVFGSSGRGKALNPHARCLPLREARPLVLATSPRNMRPTYGPFEVDAVDAARPHDPHAIAASHTE